MNKENRRQLQRTLYGTFESASPKTPAKHMINKVINELKTGSSKDIVAAVWLNTHRTQAFISSIPEIETIDLAVEEYLAHILEQNCFETLTRNTRAQKSGLIFPDRVPGWYDAYLETDHWKNISHLVKQSAGFSCVACNRTRDLQVHHRHYFNLGNESPSDTLTCFCGSCHKGVHSSCPNLKPPKDMPEHLTEMMQSVLVRFGQ